MAFRAWPLMIIAVVLPFLADASVPSHALQQVPIAESDWISLGPAGPNEVFGIGVSTSWPSDPFLIVRLEAPYDLTTGRRGMPDPPAARSLDGGLTWQPLSFPPPSDWIEVLRTSGQGRVLLTLPSRNASGTPVDAGKKQLYRSVDDGETWAPSLPIATDDVKIRVSPSVAVDGRAFLLDGYDTYETRDAGATWQPREIIPGQILQDLRFSPNYASDRTIIASAVSSGFPRPTQGIVADTSDRSAGVLVSRDEGTTWSTSAGGLMLDGMPFRHVQAIAISPSFGRDRTLFAFAWGPVEVFDDGRPRNVRSALFRSQDAGTTWESVWQPPSVPIAAAAGGLVPRHWLTIAPSPTFADDGKAMIAVDAAAGTPGSLSCALFSTTDRGDHWLPDSGMSQGAACWGLIMLPRQPPVAVWGASVGGSSSELFSSIDGGRTRLKFGPPAPRTGGPIPRLPILSPDGTAFVGAMGGMWMLPARAAASESVRP